ncbi:MAG TPA: hypothetical protein VLM05_07070 [Mycobacteriales bacterium]|nr:hypothetical protein [Mycobacteriales bacterium]
MTVPTDGMIAVSAVPGVARAPRALAVGMNLGRLSTILVQAGDGAAPHFADSAGADRDVPVAVAVDGRSWYRPDLRVSDRSSSIGPDVWFLKDADGVVRLEFQLEETSAAGPDASPFAVTVDSVTLQWTEGGVAKARAFSDPTIGPSADPAARPHFVVTVGDVLGRDEVQSLYHALSTRGSDARLLVGMSYGYWIDSVVVQPDPQPQPQPQPDPQPQPQPHPRPRPRPDPDDPRPRPWPNKPGFPRTVEPFAAIPRLAAAPEGASTGTALSGLVGLRALGDRGVLIRDHRIGRLDPDQVAVIVNENRQLESRQDFHRVSYTRTVPFAFDEALDANTAIYRAIKGEALEEEWTSGPNGWLRKAEFPNTVYRLPDQVRLAFNADLGVPHVLPTLYRDDAGEPKVRVVMQLRPWHDPAALVEIGDLLGTAPDIVSGGYESATLTFTGAFPDEIRALAGASTQITLESTTEVTLDLTVEFFNFLSQLLTGPIGVTGTVSVTLGHATGADGTAQPIVRQVPVRLSLGLPAALPLDVSVPADALSPTAVTVTNKSGAAASVGGCEPRLLQFDANSVLPLEVFRARSTGTFPLALPAGASAQIPLAPVDADGARLWNAVLAQLTDVRLELDPKAALDRIYEVAPTGTVSWKLDLDCPPLVATPGPARFASVVAIDVRVTRADGRTETAHLTRGNAAVALTMQRTLAELAASGGSVSAFSYMVRNLYEDHAGQWGEAQQGEGSSFTVYPNDPTGD